MDVELVIERVQEVATARRPDTSDLATVRAALTAVSQLRSWLSASEAALASKLRDEVSFPEKDLADCTRTSLGDAAKATERADTLAALPGFADALDQAAVTPGHIDEITRKSKGLSDAQRREWFERVARLVHLASVASTREFAKRLDLERRSVERGDGIAKLARQRSKTEFRDWTDGEGMYCYAGRADPLTGAAIRGRLDAELRRLFADGAPEGCPDDPVLRRRHLAGLAVNSIVSGHAIVDPGTVTDCAADETSLGTAAPAVGFDVLVVVDASQPDGAGGPLVDWGIPVEVPTRVLADLVGTDHAHVDTVVVRNGVVLHAPGALNLGRSARLANRAQRRALRALYATCAIPGCEVHARFTKAHHVVWWEHGGRTDLANLLPVCSHHHALIHRDRWRLTLGPQRELTIEFADGSIQTTGPPTRRPRAA